jgi:hypothetical protein
MAGTTIYYDRVNLTLFGAPYLQDGNIMNFSADVDLNTNLVQGMTQTGVASGGVIGNQAVTITWEEFYTQSTQMVDLVNLIRNNPAAGSGQLIVQPLSVGAGVPNARAIVFTGLFIPRLGLVHTPGQGQVATRPVTLLATQFAYL